MRLNSRRLYIASAYVEPGEDKFNTLAHIDRFAHHHKDAYVILGMDGNGKHPSWGCAQACERGSNIFDICGAGELEPLNQGQRPTFESIVCRKHVSSIIDVTFCSGSLLRHVQQWTVNDSACVASDHHAIEFELSPPSAPIAPARESTYLYDSKTADWAQFRDSFLDEIAESPILTSLNQPAADIAHSPELIDTAVDELARGVTSACEQSMRRRGSFKPYNPFWTEDLEKEKKAVIKLHHHVIALKHRHASADDIAHAHQAHVVAKKAYAKSVSRASHANFREFCNKQGREDVWSLTNRLIKDSLTSEPPSTLKVAGSLHHQRVRHRRRSPRPLLSG